MNSTVAPITIITSKEGRPISQLQHGLWGKGFSSLFHTDCPRHTGNAFQLSALASHSRQWGTLTPETGVRGAILRNIRRSGAMGRTLKLTWLVSTVGGQRDPRESSVSCQNKALNTQVLKPWLKALQSNRGATVKGSWSLSTAVPAHTTALERTHHSTSLLTSLLSDEHMKDNKVPAGSGRNTLPRCILHVLFTSTSGGLLL